MALFFLFYLGKKGKICLYLAKSHKISLENVKTVDANLKKLKMLIGIVGIASVLCQSYGVYHDEKVQKIKSEKHGYKSKSFARVGLDKWQWVFEQSFDYFEEFIAQFIRYIRLQKHHYMKKYYATCSWSSS